MYTTSKQGRTGYGNKAYASRQGFDGVQVAGWVLFGLGVFSLLFLFLALRQKNGFKKSWHSVLAMVVQQTIADAIMHTLINASDE